MAAGFPELLTLCGVWLGGRKSRAIVVAGEAAPAPGGGAPGGRKKRRRRGSEYIPSPFDRPDPETVRLVEEALKQALPQPTPLAPPTSPPSPPPLPGDAVAVAAALSGPIVAASLLEDRPLTYVAPIDRAAQAKRRANLEAVITLLLLS